VRTSELRTETKPSMIAQVTCPLVRLDLNPTSFRTTHTATAMVPNPIYHGAGPDCGAPGGAPAAHGLLGLQRAPTEGPVQVNAPIAAYRTLDQAQVYSTPDPQQAGASPDYSRLGDADRATSTVSTAVYATPPEAPSPAASPRAAYGQLGPQPPTHGRGDGSAVYSALGDATRAVAAAAAPQASDNYGSLNQAQTYAGPQRAGGSGSPEYDRLGDSDSAATPSAVVYAVATDAVATVRRVAAANGGAYVVANSDGAPNPATNSAV